ncbi:MAG: DUF5706 domain-containing protein [Flavobacteriales bacterium]|nr:DUF5706 domain-containing protein [Flavobacteriales bacterium]
MEEHYRMILQRIDGYAEGVNTKGTVIVAFNTFLFGTVVAQQNELMQLADASSYPKLILGLLVVMFLLEVASTFFVGMAVFPYLKSGNSHQADYRSHIFFKSIAEFKTEKEFLISCEEYQPVNYLEDLKHQIYVLSKGLTKKYEWIGYAMWAFFLTLIIITVIAALITF